MKQADDDIVSRFNRGDSVAFESIYRQYHTAIFYFVRHFVPEREDAEDITADIFYRLWAKRESLDTVQNIRAFLYTTAKNACIDFLRQQKKQQDRKEKMLQLLELHPEEGVLQDEIKAQVLRYIYEEIERLPRTCKKIFKMSYLEGMSGHDIAESMGIHVQSVYNHKQRALKLLRIALLKRNIFHAGYLIVIKFLFFS